MSKYREEYMESLTQRIIEINKKEVLTEEDKINLLKYKKELANYEYVPLFDRIINIYKKINKGENNDGI